MLERVSLCLINKPFSGLTVPWYPKAPLGSWVLKSQSATFSTDSRETLQPACFASQALRTPYWVIEVSPVSWSG